MNVNKPTDEIQALAQNTGIPADRLERLPSFLLAHPDLLRIASNEGGSIHYGWNHFKLNEVLRGDYTSFYITAVKAYEIHQQTQAAQALLPELRTFDFAQGTPAQLQEILKRGEYKYIHLHTKKEKQWQSHGGSEERGDTGGHYETVSYHTFSEKTGTSELKNFPNADLAIKIFEALQRQRQMQELLPEYVSKKEALKTGSVPAATELVNFLTANGFSAEDFDSARTEQDIILQVTQEYMSVEKTDKKDAALLFASKLKGFEILQPLAQEISQQRIQAFQAAVGDMTSDKNWMPLAGKFHEAGLVSSAALNRLREIYDAFNAFQASAQGMDKKGEHLDMVLGKTGGTPPIHHQIEAAIGDARSEATAAMTGTLKEELSL